MHKLSVFAAQAVSRLRIAVIPDEAPAKIRDRVQDRVHSLSLRERVGVRG